MFKQRSILTLVLVLVLVLATVAGCASGSAVSNDRDYQTMETTAAAMAAGDYAAEQSKGGMAPDGSGSYGSEPGSGAVTGVERKIIRNASIGLEVVDVTAAYDQILAYALARQGYETMRNEQRSEDWLVLYATIKIKPEELDGLIDFIGTLGTALRTQISTDDITTNYYDTQTRLRTMEKSLERYTEFLDRAETIEEVLQVQSYINQLTVEIESMKGMLRLWDSMLAESTVNLEIRQVNDPVQIKKEITWSALSWADMAYLMRSGLTRISNGFVTVLQWLLIALVAASPLLVIAGIVFLVWRRRRNRKGLAPKQRKGKGPDAPSGPSESNP